MKVLLINAPHAIPKMYGLKKPISNLVYKQLGIGYIAAALESSGHNVVYLDSQAKGMNIHEVIDFIGKESPELVGIPCFILGRNQVYELVRQIKSRFARLPVVLGGPQITLFADRVFEECPDVEMVLRGEAEFSMVELASRIEKNEPVSTVPGIAVRNTDGTVLYGPSPETRMNLDEIPFPARHVYENHLYNPMPMILSLPAMKTEQVITSRGCDWGRCRFCYQSNPNMPCYRRRSPENVIAEIRQLVHEQCVEFIVFTDDDFLRDESWIDRFCELYKKEGFRFKWNAIGRVNTVSQGMLQKVAKAGCVHITYGLETGNQETLNLICKGTTLDQARNAVKWAHDAGMLVRGYIIFGLPRETPEMAKKTVDFVIDLDIDYVTFAPYHVLEGTALEAIALQEGHCINHDNVSCQIPSYLPNTYTDSEQLKRVIHEAYMRFYFRPRYILKALWWAKNPLLWPSYVSKIWVGLQITFLSNKQ